MYTRKVYIRPTEEIKIFADDQRVHGAVEINLQVMPITPHVHEAIVEMFGDNADLALERLDKLSVLLALNSLVSR